MDIRLKAEFNNGIRKFSLTNCKVEKVIELTQEQFHYFYNNLDEDQDFIKDNIDLMYEEDKTAHCLLVLGENIPHGVLVESEGYDYARYCAFVPNVKSFLREKSMSPYLKELNEKVEDVINSVNEILKSGDENINIDIKQLSFMAGFDLSKNEAVCLTVEKMLEERANIISAKFDFTNNKIEILQKELESEIILKPLKIMKIGFVGAVGKLNLIQNSESYNTLKQNYNQKQTRNDTCVVNKIIELSDKDFQIFSNNLNSNNIVNEHPVQQSKSRLGEYHCLFIKPENADEGVVIYKDRKSGICYSAYSPSIEEFQEISCNQKAEQKNENEFDITM